jgi:archaellum biogenesis ATPase FlaH
VSRHSPIRTAWLARPVHGVKDDGTIYGSCKKCGALATLSADDQIKCKDGCSHADSAAAWLDWHQDFERAAKKTGAPKTNGAAPPSTDRYAGRVLDVRALLATPEEPIPWRCEGLAADGYLTVLAGRGGEGKSWMALALACGVARGKPAAGIPCTAGKALIFDAENGPPLIARRLRAAQVGPDLAVQPVDAGGLRFTDDLGWMRTEIEAQGADLVVFDSLRVLSSGAKESDGDEMEPIITRLRQLARDTGVAAVLIHHRGKSEINEYRGSSVILDQTDMLFTLGRVPGDPDGRRRRKITTVKCRIEEEPEAVWVKIEADRDRGLVTVGAAEPYEEEERERPRDHHREDVLAKLGGIPRSERNIAKATDLPRTTTQRLLADLEHDGLAAKQPDGWVAHRPVAQGDGPGGPPPANAAVEPNEGGPPEGVIELPLGHPPDAVCRCGKPARSPRADGPDHCQICKRPIGGGGAA